MFKASLGEPLQVSALDSEGHLIIPTSDEVGRYCPVKLTAEQFSMFEAWRKEFPRLNPQPVIAQPPPPTAVTNPTGDVGVAKVGSQATPDELSTSFKHEVIKEVDLPEGGVHGAQHIKFASQQPLAQTRPNGFGFATPMPSLFPCLLEPF